MSIDKNNKEYITKEGLEELKSELNTLVTVTREEVKADLKVARELGDLSENADYDAARDRQARVEARITEIENIIKNSEIIKERKRATKTVKLGSVVTILDLQSKEEETFSIVGSVEADPMNGKLSYVTPLAKAMLDRKVDEVVSVEIAQPYDIKIIKIK
ncbi:MAG: transcription elongation factor GreA [Erysipelotrichaceae bacterium]